jgi:hypothetical protein
VPIRLIIALHGPLRQTSPFLAFLAAKTIRHGWTLPVAQFRLHGEENTNRIKKSMVVDSDSIPETSAPSSLDLEGLPRQIMRFHGCQGFQVATVGRGQGV